RRAQRRFDVREPLLDVSTRRALVADHALELELTFGGFRRGGQTVSARTVGRVLQRVRCIGQLPLEGAPDRCGFGELRGELGFALCQSLDIRGMCLKSLPGPIECRLSFTR